MEQEADRFSYCWISISTREWCGLLLFVAKKQLILFFFWIGECSLDTTAEERLVEQRIGNQSILDFLRWVQSLL